MWKTAVIGEIGEFANFYKKHVRGDVSLSDFRKEAGAELADIFTYINIMVFQETKSDSSLKSVPEHTQVNSTDTVELLIVELCKRVLEYAPERKKHRLYFSTLRLFTILELNPVKHIVNKFNEVSRRVECPIFIECDDDIYEVVDKSEDIFKNDLELFLSSGAMSEAERIAIDHRLLAEFRHARNRGRAYKPDLNFDKTLQDPLYPEFKIEKYPTAAISVEPHEPEDLRKAAAIVRDHLEMPGIRKDEEPEEGSAAPSGKEEKD
jgi:hypothetical protein